MIALFQACETANIRQFIQISAPDARLDSSTEFYRSKAAADNALKNSTLAWTILRPGLVISPQTYGGTKLLRQLAAIPYLQPLALGQSQIKTVHVSDVATAVCLTIEKALHHADLIYPVLIALFSAFWIASGWIGLWQHKVVIDILSPQLDIRLSTIAVFGGSLADIAIGLGLLIRPWLKTAAGTAILIALSYMFGSIIFTLHLWADPLGPLVKIIPVILTAITILTLTPER